MARRQGVVRLKIEKRRKKSKQWAVLCVVLSDGIDYRLIAQR